MFSFVRHAVDVVCRRSTARQCGALCWRETDGVVEILLITSRANKEWIIPKGWPMPGKTLAQAAAEEAWEEAGIRGVVEDQAVGSYRYIKRRGGKEIAIDVTVFPLEVAEEHDAFREQGQREKCWLSPIAAAEIAANDTLAALLAAFHPTSTA
ncbi:NUDIX hydrolase [Cereibacter sp. SYSU M97828]|nr:NUDIX hydrolase [Cereibacter flavus]